MRYDAATVTIETRGGKRIKERVVHCLGSAEKPMTNDQLSTKFLDQATTVLSRNEGDFLLEKCWSLEELSSVSEIFDIYQLT